jgi:hypothetical protein
MVGGQEWEATLSPSPGLSVTPTGPSRPGRAFPPQAFLSRQGRPLATPVGRCPTYSGPAASSREAVDAPLSPFPAPVSAPPRLPQGRHRLLCPGSPRLHPREGRTGVGGAPRTGRGAGIAARAPLPPRRASSCRVRKNACHRPRGFPSRALALRAPYRPRGDALNRAPPEGPGASRRRSAGQGHPRPCPPPLLVAPLAQRRPVRLEQGMETPPSFGRYPDPPGEGLVVEPEERLERALVVAAKAARAGPERHRGQTRRAPPRRGAGRSRR